jgi:DNA polymerase-3 subunit alpha
MSSQSAVENLIKVGAFASIEPERARLIVGLEQAWLSAQKASSDTLSGQVSMFGDDNSTSFEPPLPASYIPFHREHNMALEKELLGIYLSDHPLDQYSTTLAKITSHTCGEARRADDKEPVVVAGVISNVRPIYTKVKNELMFYITLEDRSGSVSATIFPRKAKEYGYLAVQDSVVLVEGVVNQRESFSTPKAQQAQADDTIPGDDDAPDLGTTQVSGGSGVDGEIRVEKIRAIAQLESNEAVKLATEAAAIAPSIRLVNIMLDQSHLEKLPYLKNVLKNNPGDTPILFHVYDGKNDHHVSKFDPLLRVSSDREVIDYIRGLVGDEDQVWVE